MRRTKRMMALVVAVVLSMAMSMTAFAATNYKSDILAKMDAAAKDLGVQGGVTYQNARKSVDEYTGTITEAQYKAALAEIDTIKGMIEDAGGKDAVLQDKALQDKLIQHVINAGAKVGITIVYDGKGIGHITANNPIKDTGADYSSLFALLAAAAALCGGCALAARKENLFA